MVEDLRPPLPIHKLGPYDVGRDAHKMEDPGQIEANRDLPPGAPSDVEPQRVRRAAIKVDSRLVWSVAAVDVVQAREPPRDGQEIDIREERDKHLDAQIEPVPAWMGFKRSQMGSKRSWMGFKRSWVSLKRSTRDVRMARAIPPSTPGNEFEAECRTG